MTKSSPKHPRLDLNQIAASVVNEATILHLSEEDQVRFAEALLNPPELNAALKRAFVRRKRLLAIC